MSAEEIEMYRILVQIMEVLERIEQILLDGVKK